MTSGNFKCSVARRVAFSWNGLPQYAARLIRAAIDRLEQDCVVIGSKPGVPVKGMEEALRQSVHWVETDCRVSWSELGLEPPDVFIQSGWSYPAFAKLGREVKARGGHIIGLSDANWRGDFRQLVLAPVVFRAWHRKHFDAMIVPGEQGARLMRYFGMPAQRVRKGMYGADPGLFNSGSPLRQRPKTFLYVGQFIERKDVLGLSRAFLKFTKKRPGWTLRLIGRGVQRNLIPKDPRITVEDFVQPDQLVERYRQARFFVLPSRAEAWGVVVHEAALCGCALVLSDAIGSADDLADPLNSIRFRSSNKEDLVRALTQAADFDDARLAAAETQSRATAAKFGPDRFAEEAVRLIEYCLASAKNKLS